ncbi:MAG: C69 family dipeptidase [Bacteroidetes bacterium]|nr:C69 family dipeptidase [Bacteroidota bacterium]
MRLQRVLFMILSLWILTWWLDPLSVVHSCTNVLVTKGASKDGSTMITYAADSHTLYGELYFRPAADYPDGAMVDVIDWDSGNFLGRIRQVRHTYSVVGNMNEHQVSIGETTYGGRPELVDTTGLIDYGSLMYIALQRARTAREAIHVMTSLVAEYGYNSSGESFSISDPNEVWIMEMIGKGPGKKGAVWVARRIPDGFIAGHANHARITTFPRNDTLNCLYAPDVVTVARERGYFTGRDEEFSFSDAYAPLDFGAARFCEARVWSVFNRVAAGMDKYLSYARGQDLTNRMPLWIKPDRKLTVHDVMELMRDYFQGTEFDMSKDVGAGPYGCPYRWRPMTWKVDSTEYLNERAIATQQTGFSFVAQARSWLPDHIGGIFWFGVDDIYHTVYTPMYCSITRVPHGFAEGNGNMMEFSDDAAFWVFNQVSNLSYTRFDTISVDIRRKQAELEGKYLALTPAIDNAALTLTKQGKEQAIQFLTEYSVNQGQSTLREWKQLYRSLFVTYMDGNIKTKVPGQLNPKVYQPGYSQEWYRTVARETGEKLRVVGSGGH